MHHDRPATGKMDVGNPADFDSAGLMHQYGGAWRSDLLTMQLGTYECDVIVGRKFESGVYASAGYGIDDDRRQVAYIQLTLNF